MLNKICFQEGVELVKIVRKQEQVDLLTKLGATFVVNSSSESFKKDLYKAIESTVELSFEEAMTPEVIAKYNAKTTGGKYIFNPNKG
jgi:NADPH-dependent curcumin reductase CurA